MPVPAERCASVERRFSWLAPLATALSRLRQFWNVKEISVLPTSLGSRSSRGRLETRWLVLTQRRNRPALDVSHPHEATGAGARQATAAGLRRAAIVIWWRIHP
jgi:hypothetical protein